MDALPKCHSSSSESWTEALLVLLESSKQQAEKIRRLEEIVTSQQLLSNKHPKQQLQGPLALSVTHDVNSLQLEVQQLQAANRSIEEQQQAAQSSSKMTAETVRKLEQRVKQLEQQGQVQQQICVRAAKDSSSFGPIAERIQLLEQRADNLSENAADIEEQLKSSVQAVRVLRDELKCQLDNVRADTKQALSLSANKLRAELEDIVGAKARHVENQLRQEIEGLAARFESRTANVRLAVTAALSGDIDARLTAAQGASQQRLEQLQEQLDRLSDTKADMLLVTQYTEQVTDMFEKLSNMVVDSTQNSIADLVAKQQQLVSAVQSLTANKADSRALLQHQQQAQQQISELQRSIAAAHSTAKEAATAAAATKRAVEPVEGLKLDLADVQGSVGALQAATAGLEAASELSSSHVQQQARQLQELASTYHMLRQQLVALTNQIDPAAAAVLAAAADGNKSATVQFCELLGTSSQTGLPTVGSIDSAGNSSSSPNSALRNWLSKYPIASSGDSRAPTPEAVAAARQADGGASSSSVAGAGVLRHLPVTMRLLLLENGMHDLKGTVGGKAGLGDMQAVAAQIEALKVRLSATADGVRDLTSSMNKRLEDHAGRLLQVTASVASLEDRPTQAEVCEMLQQALADAHGAASVTAAASSKAAVQPVQQQLDIVAAELQDARNQLQAAKRELNHLKDWQVLVGDKQREFQHHIQQAKQQLSQQICEQKHELQQQIDGHTSVVKQLISDQAVSHGDTKRLAALDSKVTLLAAEVDRLDGLTATAVQSQHKLTESIRAVESCSATLSTSCAADLQQVRAHVCEALAEAHSEYGARLSALETAAAGQAEAVAELAGVVACLPSKEGIKDAVVSGSQATTELLLKEHQQQEQDRWEVWLDEFVRLLEQRPTNTQLQQKLTELQQQWQQQLSACKEVSSSTAETVATRTVAAALDEGVGTQLRVLDMRLDTVEAGLQGLGGQAEAVPAASTAYAAHCVATQDAAARQREEDEQVSLATVVGAAETAYAAGQMALLLRQVGDVQLQLLFKADKVDVQQQLLVLQQAMCDVVRQEELEEKLEKKLDLEVFLASVAARHKAARGGNSELNV